MEVNEIRVPDFGELFAYTLEISDERLHASQSPSQLQLKIARDIVEDFSDVLVNPSAMSFTTIYMVSMGRNAVTKNAALLALINKHDVKIKDEQQATSSILAAALSFTVTSRMSPEWNRVGSRLIQGVNFLERVMGRKYRQIELSVTCLSSGTVTLTSKAEIVRMYPMETWQLDLPSKYDPDFCHPAPMDTTISNVMGDAKSTYLQHPHWCVVLPKLSRGQVVAVRHRLRSDSPFANYAQLRQYWRDSYGYSLPKDPPPIYFELEFCFGRKNGRPSDLFTYPSYCVLSGFPSAVPNVDSQELNMVCYAFSQLLRRKLSHVFGVPSQFCRTRTSYHCVPRPLTDHSTAQDISAISNGSDGIEDGVPVVLRSPYFAHHRSGMIPVDLRASPQIFVRDRRRSGCSTPLGCDTPSITNGSEAPPNPTQLFNQTNAVRKTHKLAPPVASSTPFDKQREARSGNDTSADLVIGPSLTSPMIPAGRPIQSSAAGTQYRPSPIVTQAPSSRSCQSMMSTPQALPKAMAQPSRPRLSVDLNAKGAAGYDPNPMPSKFDQLTSVSTLGRPADSTKTLNQLPPSHQHVNPTPQPRHDSQSQLPVAGVPAVPKLLKVRAPTNNTHKPSVAKPDVVGISAHVRLPEMPTSCGSVSQISAVKPQTTLNTGQKQIQVKPVHASSQQPRASSINSMFVPSACSTPLDVGKLCAPAQTSVGEVCSTPAVNSNVIPSTTTVVTQTTAPGLLDVTNTFAVPQAPPPHRKRQKKANAKENLSAKPVRKQPTAAKKQRVFKAPVLGAQQPSITEYMDVVKR